VSSGRDRLDCADHRRFPISPATLAAGTIRLAPRSTRLSELGTTTDLPGNEACTGKSSAAPMRPLVRVAIMPWPSIAPVPLFPTSLPFPPEHRLLKGSRTRRLAASYTKLFLNSG
jgi:hypothetical protein